MIDLMRGIIKSNTKMLALMKMRVAARADIKYYLMVASLSAYRIESLRTEEMIAAEMKS